jgi:sulfopropanediol 3-dehydrogenase
MAIYIKKAKKTSQADTQRVGETVSEMLKEIRRGGEDMVLELAKKFDGWDRRDVRVSKEELETLIEKVPQNHREDIRFAYDQIHGFAVKQKESFKEFETELIPGVRLGQKLVPCNCVGCYVPGGRFAHVASALMSVATAKAAGVPSVTVCTPPRGETINPTVAYALQLAGADTVLALGGVQAVASMAFGLFTGEKADIVVGPGNAFVAEAKRLLFGEVSIDVIAGPTESLIIADKTADPTMVAVDLVSQAEHGLDSPVWLITDSHTLAERVLSLMPSIIADMPNPDVPRTSWDSYGEIILCEDRGEMAQISDDYAAEHVQVMAEDLDWWVGRLRNYGSLFLGEECTVSYGDKASGTNHILPTLKAARYSGGLSVHKFMKVLTWQRMTKEGAKSIAAVTSRISRMEGMEGHARAADLRLRRFFPDEKFSFEVYEHKF